MAEETTPTAPAEATKAPESVADNSTNTNTEPAKAPENPDMHGFTSEQLADMKKFFDNNGGFDGVKAKISNPEKPAEKPAEEPEKKEEPTSHTETQPVQQQQKPQGRTNDDLMAEYYFEKLSRKPEFAAISKEIANGSVLKEMANLGIQYKYADGSWNNDRINDYLELRAKTVPAKPTDTEPNASAAPTVNYVEVGDKIDTIEQAYKVIMQPNHPKMQMAEDFIKNYYNPNSGKKG